MEPALKRVAAAVEASDFAMPVFDVISNVDGRPYRDVETIKANLIRSVVDEVRWHDTAECLLSYRLDMVDRVWCERRFERVTASDAGAPPAAVVSDFAGIERLRSAIAGPASAGV